MAASLILYRKRRYDDGGILEMTLWELSSPVRGSGHRLKYSLFYGHPGVRLVGYDNEAGKGDHRHYGDREEPYQFTEVRRLVGDFLADIRRLRRSKP